MMNKDDELNRPHEWLTPHQAISFTYSFFPTSPATSVPFLALKAHKKTILF